jgi:mono/diheme cytochrome c family protein
MTRTIVAVFVAASIGAAASRPRAQAADAPNQGPDSTLSTPAMIDAGRKIFHGKGTCFACHGANLQGGPVAPPLTGPTFRHISGSFNSIVNRVDNGYPGSVMVAHPGRITEAQVVQVATYVYAVSHGKAQP